jgi:purine-binding chemotaxis protein CheW
VSEARRICIVEVDDASFGIDVCRIRELIRSLPVSPVPLADPVVAGLLNLRGQIVIALDLRQRLCRAPRTEGTPMHVVVQTQAGMFSLLVDRIGDVIDVDEGQLTRVPDAMPHEVRAIVTATLKLPDRLLLIIDPDRATAIGPQGDLPS